MTTALLAASLALGTGGIVSFLIWLLILALVVWAVFLVLGMLPLPEPVKQIATVVIAIILLLVLLGKLGIAI